MNSEELPPYSPEEMGDLMKKDQRLLKTMTELAQKKQETSRDMQRLHIFLYNAIKRNGAIRVGPNDLIDFKENFKAFTFSKEGTDFILDIQRIILEGAAPNGIESNQPITQ